MRRNGWMGGLAFLAALTLGSANVEAAGFNAVHSRDGYDVWAVGDGGTVWRSLDGGAIWGSYPLGGVDHNGVGARGAVVIIVADNGVCNRSDDYGVSFSSTVLAGGATLNDVCFPDESNGWIVADGGVILKTTDGGANFSAQTSGTAENLNAVRFLDDQEGWAVGSNGTVVYTSDGGANWTASTPFSSSADLLSVEVLGSTVYVGGEDAFLATSINGGGSWTEHDLRIRSRENVDGIALLPGGDAWLCGGGGYLRSTADDGASWSFAQHSIVTGLSDVHFVDDDNGWACAARSNNVLHTTDGGATWSVPGGAGWSYTWTLKQSSPGTVRGNTFDIDPFDRDKLYVVMAKTVYTSTNRGETWSVAATIPGSGTKTNSFYVNQSNPAIWVAAVQSGDRITRTTNSGLSWTNTLVEDMSEYGMPMQRDPDNPDILFYGTEGPSGGSTDGRLYKSTNFGATWTSISSTVFRSPCDIEVIADTDPQVIFLGDGVTGSGNGQMFRSRDAGASFQLIYTGSGSEIPGISTSVLDNQVGMSTHWSSGGVRTTSNQGANWSQVASTGSAWGTDMASDDPYAQMYGVYSGSTSYMSLNGGSTFKTSSLSGSNYGLLVLNRGEYLALQSSGVRKANITQNGMTPNNAQLLTLVAPNGGEVWQYGDVEQITWTSQNVAAVKIEYSVDGGGWVPITTATAAPAGSYPWTVPDAQSSNVKIRVSDAGDATPIDESNAAFSIIVPSVATIQSDLDFGNVPVNTSSTEVLDIVNSGNATLVISDIYPKSASEPSKSAPVVFEASRTSFSIPAAGADTVGIIFTPTDLIAYSDTMVIVSNAPGSPTYVPVQGMGEAAVAIANVVPGRFELDESTPNPFGEGGTAISYAIPRDTDVNLAVYNAAGRRVATLVDGRQSAGRYSVRFPEQLIGTSRTMSSGIYFYRLTAGDFSETKRMVFVR